MLEVNKIYLKQYLLIYFIQAKIYFQKSFHSEKLVVSEIL